MASDLLDLGQAVDAGEQIERGGQGRRGPGEEVGFQQGHGRVCGSRRGEGYLGGPLPEEMEGGCGAAEEAGPVGQKVEGDAGGRENGEEPVENLPEGR